MDAAGGTWVLGYSQSHNGAVCLLHDDEVVVAVQEERLSRVKRHFLSRLEDSLALAYCLDTAKIRFSDLDLIVCCSFNNERLELPARTMLRGVPHLTISHHLGHALAVFDTSGFDRAAVLVVDGQGGPVAGLPESERGTLIRTEIDGPSNDDASEIVSLYEIDGLDVRLVEKHVGTWIHPRLQAELDALGRMPVFGSLGGMYSAVTQQIFGSIMDPGKVMGLAPYGKPVHPVSDFFEIVDGRFHFRSSIIETFADRKARWPEHREAYTDLAASVQRALEEALRHLLVRARSLSRSPNLCYAGGVALNSVANERVVHRAGFDDVYVMPAAEDSGAAIGAAFYGLRHLRGTRGKRRLRCDTLGRTYGAEEIAQAVATRTAVLDEIVTNDVPRDVSRLLIEGKSVALFTGGSELGPRALGRRSILLDPRRNDGKEVLNARVKHREAFRPFAPAVLKQDVDRWFQSVTPNIDSPFMLRVLEFRPEVRDRLPCVVHVDGSGRAQTVTREDSPLFYAILSAFHEATGVSVLLNTSFNVMGEPIVETPEQAIDCLLCTGLDALVLENRIFTKKPGFRSVLDLFPRLNVASLQLTIPVTGRRLEVAIDGNAAIEVRARTPWGTVAYAIGNRDVVLLEAIDGRRSGREILAELVAEHGEAYDESTLTKRLMQLSRFGIVRLDGQPTAEG